MVDDSAVLDRALRALSNPSRRQIVERLCVGPATVSELAAPLAMSLAAVVQHVQILESSNLVRSEKAGRVRTCRLHSEALQAVEHWVVGRRSEWEARIDRLGDYLEREDNHEHHHKEHTS